MANVAVKPAAPEIPNKLYFRIGEVSRLTGIKSYVLRYWESEFPTLEPKKSGKGHRLYRRKDVELVLEIKYLLYGKRFTIEGARAALGSGRGKALPAAPPAEQVALFPVTPVPNLEEVRNELIEIWKMLG